MSDSGSIEISVSGNWDKFMAMLHRVLLRTPGEADSLADSYGDKLLAQVKKNASGRPGPEIQTGAYVRSWYKKRLGFASVIVNSDAPEKDRLELGFVGSDSLGRYYHQPPYPHIGPAVEQIAPDYADANQRLVIKLVEVK